MALSRLGTLSIFSRRNLDIEAYKILWHGSMTLSLLYLDLYVLGDDALIS